MAGGGENARARDGGIFPGVDVMGGVDAGACVRGGEEFAGVWFSGSELSR